MKKKKKQFFLCAVASKYITFENLLCVDACDTCIIEKQIETDDSPLSFVLFVCLFSSSSSTWFQCFVDVYFKIGGLWGLRCEVFCGLEGFCGAAEVMK